MQSIIGYARQHITDDQSRENTERLADLNRYFDAVELGADRNHLSIFVFHTEVPKDVSTISMDGNSIDHAAFDYIRLIDHFCAVASAYNPNCKIYLVTSSEDKIDIQREGVATIRLPIDSAAPMYERVVAMNAFVSSKLFCTPTAFLDSDALVNRNLAPLFSLPFDLAVTYRAAKHIMPINEGVFFANTRRISEVRGFFNRYLATYSSLAADSSLHERLGEDYGNVKRWRGGQLTLNAIAGLEGLVAEFESKNVQGAEIRYLNTETFNFDLSFGDHIIDALGSKYILHLKGEGKKHLQTVIGFQAHLFKQEQERQAQRTSGD